MYSETLLLVYVRPISQLQSNFWSSHNDCKTTDIGGAYSISWAMGWRSLYGIISWSSLYVLCYKQCSEIWEKWSHSWYYWEFLSLYPQTQTGLLDTFGRVCTLSRSYTLHGCIQCGLIGIIGSFMGLLWHRCGANKTTVDTLVLMGFITGFTIHRPFVVRWPDKELTDIFDSHDTVRGNDPVPLG